MPCTCATKSGKARTLFDRSVWRLLFDSAGKLHCTVGRTGLQSPESQPGEYGIYYPGTGQMVVKDGAQSYGSITAIDREDNGTVWLGTSSAGLIIMYDENLDQFTEIRKSESFPTAGCICAIHIHEGKIFATRCCTVLDLHEFVNSPFLLYINLPKGKAAYRQFEKGPEIASNSVPNCILKVNNHLYFSTLEMPNVYIIDLINPPSGNIPRLFLPSYVGGAQGGVYCLTYNEDDELIYGVVSGEEAADYPYQPWLFKFAPESSDYEFVRAFSTNHSESICCKYVPEKGIFIGTNTCVEQIDPETMLYRADLYLYDGTLQSLDTPIIRSVYGEQALTSMEFDGIDTLYIGTAPNAKLLALNIDSYHIQEIYTFGNA